MKPKKRRGGYTLIETLIVIAIMAILASMLLTYNNSSTGRVALYSNQATLAGVLGRAKSLALEKWNGGSSGNSACAFGVHFNLDGSYFVYESMPPCGTYSYDSSKDSIIQTLSLSGGVTFSSLPTPPDVYFVPPYLASLNATVVIQTKAGNNSASVQVTSGGAITSL